jgi:guanylate kinase
LEWSRNTPLFYFSYRKHQINKYRIEGVIMSTINIFCLVAKTKCGKNMYLERILSDKKFISKNNLVKLRYGTTKKVTKEDKDNYYYFSKEEFKDISNNEDLIECRSYYTITEGIVYYFTKSEYFGGTRNIICITTPYQYENYKIWCAKENIKHPGKYNLNMIYIESSINNRVKRIADSTSDEIEMCEVFRRFIEDKHEFDNAFERLPELIDPMLSSNVCCIRNDSKDDIDRNISSIKNFITNRINNN